MKMRLPNGFGQISKIKNRKLRNPYRAMVTVGKTAEGRPICKLLKPKAYFATYNEAYAALLEYNKHPFDLSDNTTMDELFNMWLPSQQMSATRKRNVECVWRNCSEIHQIPVRSFKPKHVVILAENCPNEYRRKTSKEVLNMMLDYAVNLDLVDRNCARSTKISYAPLEKTKEIVHRSFSDEEFKKIKDDALSGVKLAQIIYIQCYTGFRPTELITLTLDQISLENLTFTAGMKTEAGTNRTVPIHTNIEMMVKNFYAMSLLRGDKYLFDFHNYQTFNRKFLVYFKGEHHLHDGRKHFITMAKKANVDEYALKRIVGHKISDLTESVYTDRPTDWLREEMLKIP